MRAAAADFRTARRSASGRTRDQPAFALSGLLPPSWRCSSPSAAARDAEVRAPADDPSRSSASSSAVSTVSSTATLGGFAIGFANSVLGELLAADQRIFLPSFIFLLVIVVLLLRPSGLFSPLRAAATERV